MPEQKCPLCMDMARYQHEEYGKDHKLFTCKNCRLFVISSKTESLLVHAPEENLIKIAARSKAAKTGDVLYIYHEEINGIITIKTKFDQERNWS